MSGLRISDVALFDIKRLQGNEVFLRAKKNGGEVSAYIPDWLRDTLVQRAKTHGSMLFVTGESRRLETVTNTWRRRLNRVFQVAGPFEETRRRTGSGTLSRVFCSSATCPSQMWPTSSATTRTRSGSITQGGSPSAKPASRRFSRRRLKTSRSPGWSRCPAGEVKRR
jgi:hypothetical protein